MNRILRTLRTLVSRNLVITFDKIEFTYTKLTRKRLLNWLCAEGAYLLKTRSVRFYPTHLQIEPVSGCNLRCPLCYITTHNLPKGHLKFSDFKTLIDEMGDYLLFVHFWGWGEPFLNNDIFAMIKYAKDRDIRIITSTNGHFFEDYNEVERLVDSGLDALIIALDGPDQQSYEKYRHNGDFDKVLRGVRNLIQLRNSKGNSTPLINLRMVVTRENEELIPRMKVLAQDPHVDLFSLKTLGPHDDETSFEMSIPQRQEYRRYQYDQQGNAVRKKNSCKKMWNHPTVFHDGRLAPCDYWTDQEQSIGNVFGQEGNSFWELWAGGTFRDIRSRFLNEKRSILRCDSCPLNYTTPAEYVSHAFSFQEKDLDYRY